MADPKNDDKPDTVDDAPKDDPPKDPPKDDPPKNESPANPDPPKPADDGGMPDWAQRLRADVDTLISSAAKTVDTTVPNPTDDDPPKMPKDGQSVPDSDPDPKPWHKRGFGGKWSK